MFFHCYCYSSGFLGQAAIKPLKPAYCDLTDYWLCFSLPSWLVGVGVKFGGQCGRVPCTHGKSYCCSLSVFNSQKEKKREFYCCFPCGIKRWQSWPCIAFNKTTSIVNIQWTSFILHNPKAHLKHPHAWSFWYAEPSALTVDTLTADLSSGWLQIILNVDSLSRFCLLL